MTERRLKTLSFWGRPFSPLYAGAMKIRALLYRCRLLASHRVEVPVISVGNLVLGGTGKSPVVRHIARLLAAEGFQPAVISRGYRGSARAAINVVADRKQTLLSAESAGDEPFMLAATLPGIPVVTGKKRIFPARYAVEQLQAESLVLDDAFQHLAICRDLNIVLFDSTECAGNSRIFPGGPLREPVSALRRADCFIMTGTTVENRARAEQFADLLRSRFADRPVFIAGRKDYRIEDPEGQPCPVETLPAVAAFCGIAAPGRFRATLEEIGTEPKLFTAFRDHSRYTGETIAQLCRQAVAAGARALLTTEKDRVKLSGLQSALPIFTVCFDVDLGNDFDSFLLLHLQQRGKENTLSR